MSNLQIAGAILLGLVALFILIVILVKGIPALINGLVKLWRESRDHLIVSILVILVLIGIGLFFGEAAVEWYRNRPLPASTASSTPEEIPVTPAPTPATTAEPKAIVWGPIEVHLPKGKDVRWIERNMPEGKRTLSYYDGGTVVVKNNSDKDVYLTVEHIGDPISEKLLTPNQTIEIEEVAGQAVNILVRDVPPGPMGAAIPSK